MYPYSLRLISQQSLQPSLNFFVVMETSVFNYFSILTHGPLCRITFFAVFVTTSVPVTSIVCMLMAVSLLSIASDCVHQWIANIITTFYCHCIRVSRSLTVLLFNCLRVTDFFLNFFTTLFLPFPCLGWKTLVFYITFYNLTFCFNS